MLLIYTRVWRYLVEHDQLAWATPLKKTPHPHPQLAVNSSLVTYEWGFLSSSPFPAGMFTGLTFSTYSLSLCVHESKGFCHLPHPVDTVSFWDTLISGSYSLSFPSTPVVPEPCGEGMMWMNFMAGCSTDTSSLVFRVFHLGKQLSDERNYPKEEARKVRD